MKKKYFDSLGRVHIPKSIRDRLGFTETTQLKISADPKRSVIVIEKETPSCFLCGQSEDLLEIEKGVLICKQCGKKIKNQIK